MATNAIQAPPQALNREHVEAIDQLWEALEFVLQKPVDAEILREHIYDGDRLLNPVEIRHFRYKLLQR